MEWFDIIVVLLGMAALFSYVNERFLHLETTIGVMLISVLVCSVGYLLNEIGVASWHKILITLLGKIHFSDALLNGLLCFFLFAGALHIPVRSLERDKWMILALATVGTIISTFVVGTLCWGALILLGLKIDYLLALLFGAMVSPTDPIATLAILKHVGLPERLETLINGESLFNDGVAMVLVTVLSGLLYAGVEVSPSEVIVMFSKEVLGGALLGIFIGVGGHLMLKGVREHSSEVLVTLSAVAGGYALARHIEVSGPIAIVVVGLIIGNYSRKKALDESGRADLDMFWKMLDEILDVVLFVLIGMILLLVTTSWIAFAASLVAIPMVLFARWVSVSASVLMLDLHTHVGHKVWNLGKLLTWGGLKGGLPLALALGLPAGEDKDLILAMVYAVVAFSVVVQGLTIGRLFTKEDLEQMARER